MYEWEELGIGRNRLEILKAEGRMRLKVFLNIGKNWNERNKKKTNVDQNSNSRGIC